MSNRNSFYIKSLQRRMKSNKPNGTHVPCSRQSLHSKAPALQREQSIGMITSIWNLPRELFDTKTRTVTPLVNMDVFDSCSVSCMKRQSRNTVLKLKEVHPHLLASFSYSTAHVTSLQTQKCILCEWHLAMYLRSFTEHVTRERLITCRHAVGSFFSLYC